jgi:integrase
MHEHAYRDGITAQREAPLILKGFQQDGEGEPRRARLLAQQALFVVRERPMMGEFVRVPGLLHRIGSYTGGVVNDADGQAYYFAQRRNSEVRKAPQDPKGALMAKNASTMRSQTPKAKSAPDMTEVLRETTKLWRKHHLSYDQSRYVVAQVRRALQLSAPRERRRTVARLDQHEVERLIEAAYRKGSRYGLMVKTLFYTGARVSEFINIQVVDLRLDLNPPQIYLAVAKGGSDGYVPILPALAQELRTHLRGRKAM